MRRRSRSPRERRERERSRHRSRSRERRKRRSRERDVDDIDRRDRRDKDREREKEKKKKRSRSRERDRSEKKRDRRDRERDKDRERKERKPDFRDGEIKIKEEPIDGNILIIVCFGCHSPNPINFQITQNIHHQILTISRMPSNMRTILNRNRIGKRKNRMETNRIRIIEKLRMKIKDGGVSFSRRYLNLLSSFIPF